MQFLHLHPQRELLPFDSLKHVPSVSVPSFALGDDITCGLKHKSARIFSNVILWNEM